MKTIEEKAEAYDEAIEGIQEILSSGEDSIKISRLRLRLQGIFPELKNNEDEDERIRKEIIRVFKGEISFTSEKTNEKYIAWLEKQKDYIKLPHSAYTSNKNVIEFANKYSNAVWEELMDNFKKNGNYRIGCNDVSDIVLNAIINTHNWLEKQKEQKHTDKVKPKFKIGDFLVNDYCMGKVISLTNDAYLLDSGQGIPFSCEHNVHLWTINDAKDGDVLADKYDNIGIFREHEGKCWYSHIYLGCDSKIRGFGFGGMHEQTDTHPATKEQRDLLFQAIDKSRFEWNTEKEKLKLKELANQEEAKSSDQETSDWSEEDRSFYFWTICNLTNLKDRFGESYGQSGKCIDWLKSLKGRVLSQSLRPLNTWKPSDLPHWKKSTLPNDNSTGFNGDYFLYKGYNINYKELFEKLPKDD